MCLEPDLAGNGMAYFSRLVRGVAEHHSIPVVLHLDHATELDTSRRPRPGLHVGDDRRLELTVRGERAADPGAVDLARPHGVSVEAELGHVGGMDLAAWPRRSRC